MGKFFLYANESTFVQRPANQQANFTFIKVKVQKKEIEKKQENRSRRREEKREENHQKSSRKEEKGSRQETRREQTDEKLKERSYGELLTEFVSFSTRIEWLGPRMRSMWDL